jgi:hypothetical protein
MSRANTDLNQSKYDVIVCVVVALEQHMVCIGTFFPFWREMRVYAVL